MRQVFLLGNPGTKRTLYFGRAARHIGLPVSFLDWQKWPDVFAETKAKSGQVFLKIDPPLWDNCQLDDLPGLAAGYELQLKSLANIAEKGRCEFLNHPESIRMLLDKRECKRVLWGHGLPVTEGLGDVGRGESRYIGKTESAGEDGRSGERDKTEESAGRDVRSGESGKTESAGKNDRSKERGKSEERTSGEGRSGEKGEADGNDRCGRISEGGKKPGRAKFAEAEELLAAMEESRTYQVFIKPAEGSGAAGVAAFRWQPRTGRMALYTCALLCEGDKLINTKRLRCFREKAQVFSLLSRLLRLDCIVERWYPKAEYQGCPYDLRVVVQDGRRDFWLARLSHGPITNLHLNNHPLPASLLGLPMAVEEEVERLCLQTLACFPGLRSAGVDVLLEKGSLKPRIIEMNGQGDLIYQDIYQDNGIYGHQAEMMMDWLKRER